MSAELQNRFIKRPLHGCAKVTDDQILIAYRQRQWLDEDISKIVKQKEAIINELGVTVQAFNMRIKTLKKGGFIED